MAGNISKLTATGELSASLSNPEFGRNLPMHKPTFRNGWGAIAGSMGQATEKGFVLNDASVQVYEKKPKADKVVAT
jgi:hypothetical protein